MSAEPHQRLYFHPQNLLTKKDLSHNFPFVREMSTDTTAAPENDFTMEMLDQCRFYVEGVALLPVSVIGIIGNKFANGFLQREMSSICVYRKSVFVFVHFYENLKTADIALLIQVLCHYQLKSVNYTNQGSMCTTTYLNEFSIFNALLFHKSFCLND